MKNIKKQDPQVYQAIIGELRRQQEGMELIASENYVSEAVLEALGSVFTNNIQKDIQEIAIMEDKIMWMLSSY